MGLEDRFILQPSESRGRKGEFTIDLDVLEFMVGKGNYSHISSFKDLIICKLKELFMPNQGLSETTSTEIGQTLNYIFDSPLLSKEDFDSFILLDKKNLDNAINKTIQDILNTDKDLRIRVKEQLGIEKDEELKKDYSELLNILENRIKNSTFFELLRRTTMKVKETGSWKPSDIVINDIEKWFSPRAKELFRSYIKHEKIETTEGMKRIFDSINLIQRTMDEKVDINKKDYPRVTKYLRGINELSNTMLKKPRHK